MKVNIQRVDNGWIVTAGCVTLVYASAATILTDFTSWITHPEHTERHFTEKYGKGGGVPTEVGEAEELEKPNSMIGTAAGLISSAELHRRTSR